MKTDRFSIFAIFAFAVSLFACSAQEKAKHRLPLDKRVAIMEKYDYIRRDSCFVIAVKDKRYFLLDADGGEIALTGYDEVYCPNDTATLARVRIGKKYGYINNKGDVVIPVEYDYTHSFSEGLASVVKDGKYGFVDMSGNVVIPFIYDGVRGSFSAGLCSVSLNGKTGFINAMGETVIPFEYDDAFKFLEGLSPVEVDDKWGCIDKDGKVVIPIKYKFVSPCREGIVGVEHFAAGWGTVDKAGNEIVSPQYTSMMGIYYMNGRALVERIDTTFYEIWEKNGKMWLDVAATGIIDREGNEIVPVKYMGVRELLDSRYYAVQRVDDELWGVLDYDGKELVPVKYDDVRAVTANIATYAMKIDDNRLYGLLDSGLNEIVTPQYTEIRFYPFVDLIKAVLPGGGYHIYDADGAVVRL